MRRLLMPLLALTLASPSPPHWAVDLGRLAPLLEQAREEEDSWEVLEQVPQAAVALDRRQIGALGWLLRHGELGEQQVAAMALAYAAEPEASRLLLRRYRRTLDPGLKAMVCLALAASSSTESREFLEGALVGEPIGDSWYPLEVAAHSLAVRRDWASVPALEQAARTGPDTFAGNAAQLALRWIRNGEATTAFEETTEELAVLAALLRAGLPYSGEGLVLYEPEHHRSWRQRAGAWFREDSPEPPEDALTVSFKIALDDQLGRAIVSAYLRPKSSCATGWDYILRRAEGARWRVVGLIRTGVS